MGAKELEWRIEGSGSGTSEYGRDLELSFYVSSLDGDLVKQRWWVEAKDWLFNLRQPLCAT